MKQATDKQTKLLLARLRYEFTVKNIEDESVVCTTEEHTDTFFLIVETMRGRIISRLLCTSITSSTSFQSINGLLESANSQRQITHDKLYRTLDEAYNAFLAPVLLEHEHTLAHARQLASYAKRGEYSTKTHHNALYQTYEGGLRHAARHGLVKEYHQLRDMLAAMTQELPDVAAVGAQR